MGAGLQSAIELQHRVFFEQHRAVRLLRAEPAYDKTLGERRLGEKRRVTEADFTFAAVGRAHRDIGLPFDRSHQRQQEPFLRHCVDQRTLAARLPQLRKRDGQQCLPLFTPGGRPYRRGRQRVALALAVSQCRLDHLQQVTARLGVGCVRRRKAISPSGSTPADRMRWSLAREPALARQKARDHVALELRLVVPGKQVAPALRHHQRHQFRRQCLQRRGSLVLGRQRQLEPEEAVTLQGQQVVGLVADLAETGCAPRPRSPAGRGIPTGRVRPPAPSATDWRPRGWSRLPIHANRR